MMKIKIQNGRYSLKGHDMSAQPVGLGRKYRQRPALKGGKS